jgi:hypothetical protein
MTILYFSVLGILGVVALSGISLAACAMLPAAVIESARHGRYSGLGDADRGSDATPPLPALVGIDAVQAHAA